MIYYVAVIEKEDNSSYGIYFPDILGCITGGDMIDEAVNNAPKALEMHLRNTTPPKASDLQRIKLAYPNECLLIVPYDYDLKEKVRSVRINITINENILRLADNEAARIGKSRSAFIADALLAKLKEV